MILPNPSLRNLKYQPYPESGQLAANMNLTVEDLKHRIGESRSAVYFYVITTVGLESNTFIQQGSGPNFQGGVISLASCKHHMRTFLDPSDWPGTWIAGFTSVEPVGKNALFCLFRVSEAFESHRAFWQSDAVDDDVKTAKAAHLDRFGDVYEPRRLEGNPYIPSNYLGPCKRHVHCEPGDWKEDIRYASNKGRKPSLLLGEVGNTYIWSSPSVFWSDNIGRGQGKSNMNEFLQKLQ